MSTSPFPCRAAIHWVIRPGDLGIGGSSRHLWRTNFRRLRPHFLAGPWIGMPTLATRGAGGPKGMKHMSAQAGRNSSSTAGGHGGASVPPCPRIPAPCRTPGFPFQPVARWGGRPRKTLGGDALAERERNPPGLSHLPRAAHPARVQRLLPPPSWVAFGVGSEPRIWEASLHVDG